MDDEISSLCFSNQETSTVLASYIYVAKDLYRFESSYSYPNQMFHQQNTLLLSQSLQKINVENAGDERAGRIVFRWQEIEFQ